MLLLFCSYKFVIEQRAWKNHNEWILSWIHGILHLSPFSSSIFSLTCKHHDWNLATSLSITKAPLDVIQIGPHSIRHATSGMRVVNHRTPDMTIDTKPWDVFGEIKDLLLGMMNQNWSIFSQVGRRYLPLQGCWVAEKATKGITSNSSSLNKGSLSPNPSPYSSSSPPLLSSKFTSQNSSSSFGLKFCSTMG